MICVQFHFGTPSKRTSCLCPAAASAHTTVSLFLCFGVPDLGAESTKLLRRKALQSKDRNLTTPPQERQRGTTLRPFDKPVPKTNGSGSACEKGGSLRGNALGELSLARRRALTEPTERSEALRRSGVLSFSGKYPVGDWTRWHLDGGYHCRTSGTEQTKNRATNSNFLFSSGTFSSFFRLN